jgi:hypothetical protein
MAPRHLGTFTVWTKVPIDLFTVNMQVMGHHQRRNGRWRYTPGARLASVENGTVNVDERYPSRQPFHDQNATVRGMRHVGTLIAAIAVVPLAWILLAVGPDRLTRVVSAVRRPRWPQEVDEPEPPMHEDLLGFCAPIRPTEPELAAWHRTRFEPIGWHPGGFASLRADSNEPWW